MTTSRPTTPDASEMLVLVDSKDEPVGELDKQRCHDGDGRLHRAFSVFVFNSAGELLIQKRGSTKRLWPGHWSNSCCSHPRVGEDVLDAAHRRLRQELGMSASLRYAFKFEYAARFQDVGSEHELCHVFVGRSDEEPDPDEIEISKLGWIGPNDLHDALEANPERFTPWLRQEWARLRSSGLT